MKTALQIIKIGGNLIESPALLAEALQHFHQIEGPKILVHGGGKRASQLLRQLGIQPQMVEGRRVTDAASLEVVTMVYAGLINKNIVAQLQAIGCQAIGLCGADLNSIQAHKRIVDKIDYGFAGDIDQVDGQVLHRLLESGFRPIFCAITHDKKGQLLNTNADTIASQLAIALAAHYQVHLKFCFEMPGVLSNPAIPNSVIRQIDTNIFEQCKQSGMISAGMIPKIDNAMAACKGGVQSVRICNLQGITSNGGTRITQVAI